MYLNNLLIGITLQGVSLRFYLMVSYDILAVYLAVFEIAHSPALLLNPFGGGCCHIVAMCIKPSLF